MLQWQQKRDNHTNTFNDKKTIKKQSNKNGNSNDSDENSKYDNRYQNCIVNQVLITIRENPVVRINQNVFSDTVFNVQSPWHHFLQSTSPIVSLCKGFHGSVLSINVMEISSRKLWCPFSEKMLKKVLLPKLPYSWDLWTLLF